MNEYRIEEKLKNLEKGLINLKEGLDSISAILMPGDDLWDNSDLIRNWHVSERTLATWRSKGLITFTKVGKKIFYDKSDRDAFIRANKMNDLAIRVNESILHS